MGCTVSRGRTILTGVLLATLSLGAHEVSALTRNRVLQTAQSYMLVSYDVTAANVHPAVMCYRPDLGANGLSKLGVGHYTGLPYSYRGGEPFTPDQIIGHLYQGGRGAGNSSTLLAAAPGCVSQHTTGIDCSQFVSAAWEASTRFTVFSFAHNDGSIALGRPARESVREADAFCIDESAPPAHHIVLFSSSVGPDNVFYSYEASSRAPARATSKLRNYRQMIDVGYHPWVSTKLKDDPAADVVGFDAVSEAGGVRLTWSTLLERDTESFVIGRSSSADGPFTPVAGPIPAKGSGSSGAAYEIMDDSPAGSEVYYELREIESTGRELRQGVVSSSEAQEAKRR